MCTPNDDTLIDMDERLPYVEEVHLGDEMSIHLDNPLECVTRSG